MGTIEQVAMRVCAFYSGGYCHSEYCGNEYCDAGDDPDECPESRPFVVNMITWEEWK